MLMNKYSINAEGKTPYEHMHGRKCNAKIVEFGERCCYYVREKIRAKLDKRWRLGVYLGMCASSNAHELGVWNGDCVKSRPVVRVLEKPRWSTAHVQKLRGTLARRKPSGATDYEDVKNSHCPYEIIDDDKKGRAKNNQSDDAQNPVDETKDNLDKRVRVTQADLIDKRPH